ncbi:DUF2004 domain-containing protein [Catenulispora rubra]|uniref:DUF2004 domain-containing protein n=1 Tax=Catenulispora rubra TaxID=280293 RepID=UPI0018920B02|nr:DUF2004 domain-containing protein [Catenulispora rubra]
MGTQVDITFDGGRVDAAAFGRLARHGVDVEALDRKARAGMRAEFAEEDSTVRFYAEHHRDELGAVFGEDGSIDLETLLATLSLIRIGFSLESDPEDSGIILDYSIGAEVTNYLIAVSFDEDGELEDISMES